MNKPIVFFDLETTGPDIVQDRAIQFAGSKTIDGNIFEINMRFKPLIAISESATAVHGITNEMIADQPTFCEKAQEVFDFMEGCDYCGHNINQFDVPLLSEELGRCGLTWPATDSRFLDTLIVFREKEKRDLAGAMRFYLGIEFTDGHDALADVRATKDVFTAQMQRYDDLSDADKYAAFCASPNALDLAGKIILNEQGEAVYSFGKDKGKSVKKNPGFGQWMLGQSFSTNTKNIVRSLISTNGNR